MIPAILDFDNYRSYEGETAPTTYAQMQTYMSNQNKIIKAIVATHLWQPSTTYIVGQVVYSNSMTLNTCARCIVAGTSAENDEPTWGTVIGAHITDNGVTWEIIATSATARVQRSLPYTWAQIKTKIQAGNFSGIEVGDYKDVTLSDGNVMRMIVAGINTFKGSGYGTGADGGTPNHIDFISQDCYPTSHTVNTTDNNNGNASQTNPFMASALYSWLNGTVSALLPSDLTAVISAKSCLMPDRYVSGSALADDNSWFWKTPGPLWLPNEVEVFGVDVLSTKPWSVGGSGCNKQYEIFRKYPEQLIKHTTNGGTGRAAWWLCSAHSGSSTGFCVVSIDGYAGSVPATYAGIYVPLCFRVI